MLDAGGTNLRVAVIWFDRAGKARVEDFHKYKMPGADGATLSAKEFFDTFAGFLEPVCQRSDAVGFCFSYPTEIYPDLDGRLLRWSKQIDAPEVVGRRVGSGISDALFARAASSTTPPRRSSPARPQASRAATRPTSASSSAPARTSPTSSATAASPRFPASTRPAR